MGLLVSAGRGVGIFRRGFTLFLLHGEESGDGADKQADDWELFHKQRLLVSSAHIVYNVDIRRKPLGVKATL